MLVVLLLCSAGALAQQRTLRETNLNAQEVDEVLDAALRVEPGTSAYISEVWVGCDCHDGAECSESAAVVIHRPGEMIGLELVNVDHRWRLAWHDDFERRVSEHRAQCAVALSLRSEADLDCVKGRLSLMRELARCDDTVPLPEDFANLRRALAIQLQHASPADRQRLWDAGVFDAPAEAIAR